MLLFSLLFLLLALTSPFLLASPFMFLLLSPPRVFLLMSPFLTTSSEVVILNVLFQGSFGEVIEPLNFTLFDPLADIGEKHRFGSGEFGDKKFELKSSLFNDGP